MTWCEKAEQFWYSVFNRNNLVINFSIFNSNIAIVLIKVDHLYRGLSKTKRGPRSNRRTLWGSKLSQHQERLADAFLENNQDNHEISRHTQPLKWI